MRGILNVLLCLSVAQTLELDIPDTNVTGGVNVTDVNFTIVYTWVDGNDKQVISDTKKYLGKVPGNRIRDRNELKFSLRSVAKYMPWYTGPIIIVTNNKAPDWLDQAHPRIRIVTHAVTYQQRLMTLLSFLFLDFALLQ